jgi:hypothetical protein
VERLAPSYRLGRVGVDRALKNYVPDKIHPSWAEIGGGIWIERSVLGISPNSGNAKCCQREDKNKGHTLFVFDNEERERMRFTDVIMQPPDWSGEYYSRKRKQEALDQIVDVPYFGASQEVALIQVADVASFFLRRYAEIKAGLVPARYPDEESRVDGWIKTVIGRAVLRPYPKVGRTRAEQLVFENAPSSIRSL